MEKKRTRACRFINTDIGKFKKSIGVLSFEPYYNNNKKQNAITEASRRQLDLFNGKQKRRKEV